MIARSFTAIPAASEPVAASRMIPSYFDPCRHGAVMMDEVMLNAPIPASASVFQNPESTLSFASCRVCTTSSRSRCGSALNFA